MAAKYPISHFTGIDIDKDIFPTRQVLHTIRGDVVMMMMQDQIRGEKRANIYEPRSCISIVE